MCKWIKTNKIQTILANTATKPPKTHPCLTTNTSQFYHNNCSKKRNPFDYFGSTLRSFFFFLLERTSLKQFKRKRMIAPYFSYPSSVENLFLPIFTFFVTFSSLVNFSFLFLYLTFFFFAYVLQNIFLLSKSSIFLPLCFFLIIDIAVQEDLSASFTGIWIVEKEKIRHRIVRRNKQSKKKLAEKSLVADLNEI